MRRILSVIAAGAIALSACSDDTVGPPTQYIFSVVPEQTELSLKQDDSVAVSAIVEDTTSGGRMYNPILEWSSDDPDVAVVEPNGDGWQVRAVGGGNTQIHAVFNAYHGPVEGTIDVSVTGVPAASFALAEDDLDLYPGDADTLRVLVRDADDNELSLHRVAWETSDDAVVSITPIVIVWKDTISVGGKDSIVVDSVTNHVVITAKDTGTAEITATVAGMADRTINVGVTKRPVDRIVMSPDVAGLHVGETLKLTATPTGANGEALTGREIGWVSTNTSIATVDAAGVVTAVGVGTVQIMATTEGKFGATSVIVVASLDH